MEGSFPEISRYLEEFHRLIEAGAGHPGVATAAHARWDAVSFERAIGDAVKRRNDGTVCPTLRTIRNWFDRKKQEIPRERFIEPILDVLFKDNPGNRGCFRALWEAARQARRASGVDADLLDSAPAGTPAEWWDVSAAENIGLGLAAVFVHPQPKSNAEDDGFPLHLTVSLAQHPDEIEGFGVLLGLRAAHLRVDAVHCQPRPMEDDAENIKERAGLYDITGPKPGPAGHLEGRPLANRKLVTMERTAGGSAKVTVSLRSRHRDLDVIPDDPGRDISTARAKILQAFLQECQVSENDRQIVWGKATMTEKPRT